MAFTEQQEKDVLSMLDAFQNGVSIADLPPATGSLDELTIEVQDKTGEPKSLNFYTGISLVNQKIAIRREHKTLGTPALDGWGNLDFLRELGEILGLGCYLVTRDRTRRKLDPTNHYRFADGSYASLDGLLGEYMWCWKKHYFGWKVEGDYRYYGVSLTPIDWDECYLIPAGGTSALGAGVVDRTNLELRSIINDDPQFRGGNADSQSAWDGTYRSNLGRSRANIAAHTASTYARKLGEGWESSWFVARAVQEYLFMLIMGTRHSQAAFNPTKDENGLYSCGLGAGITDWASADWNEYNSYSALHHLSAGVELGDGIGVATHNALDENGNVVKALNIPVFYGLKNMYGHQWDPVRGLIYDVDIDAGTMDVYVAPSLAEDYSNTSTEGMIRAAQVPWIAGYIKSRSFQNLCLAPTEMTGASATTFWCDYHWNSAASGLRCLLASGSATNGANAGAFCTYSQNAVTVAHVRTSPRLCFFDEDPSPVSITGRAA